MLAVTKRVFGADPVAVGAFATRADVRAFVEGVAGDQKIVERPGGFVVKSHETTLTALVAATIYEVAILPDDA